MPNKDTSQWIKEVNGKWTRTLEGVAYYAGPNEALVIRSVRMHQEYIDTLKTLLSWFEAQAQIGKFHNSPDMESFDGSMEGYLQKKIVEANGSTWEEYCLAIAHGQVRQ